MNNKKIINIDAEFDGIEFNEQQIVKHTGYAKASLSRSAYRKQHPFTQEQRQQIAESNRKHRAENPLSPEQKRQIGDAMRGKTLEELVGAERAAKGRKSRSEAHKGKKRPPEVGQKIAATRRANGSYENSGMTGHEHKESTKEIMALKAQVRQDLRRQLNLGKTGTLPKELLAAEYKRRGIA